LFFVKKTYSEINVNSKIKEFICHKIILIRDLPLKGAVIGKNFIVKKAKKFSEYNAKHFA